MKCHSMWHFIWVFEFLEVCKGLRMEKIRINNLNICVTNFQVLKSTISLSTQNIRLGWDIDLKKIIFNYTLLSGGLVYLLWHLLIFRNKLIWRRYHSKVRDQEIEQRKNILNVREINQKSEKCSYRTWMYSKRFLVTQPSWKLFWRARFRCW